MSRVNSLLRLSWAERYLWFQAFALLAALRLALWGLPYHRVQSTLQRLGQPSRRAQGLFPSVHGIRDVSRMVQSAARYVPGTTCLPQALAAQFLLSRRGMMTELKLGVAKCEGAMLGHAWLESEGKPVFGGTPQSLSSYRPLQGGKRTQWVP